MAAVTICSDFGAEEKKVCHCFRYFPIYLEGLMLKLQYQYFGHLMRRADSLEKTLMLGKTDGKRRRDEMVSITDSMDMNLSKLGELGRTEEPGIMQPMGSQRVRHNVAAQQQS